MRVIDTAKAVTGSPGGEAADTKAGLHDGGFLHLSAKGYRALAEAVIAAGVLASPATQPRHTK